MHVQLHAGLDPASKLFGFCWLDGDGKPLLPINDLQGIMTSFVTFRATKEGKAQRNGRLDQIEIALETYLRTFPERYFTERNRQLNGADFLTWEIASFGIEEPSDQFKTDRHDTAYVNGMSARMAYTVCREVSRSSVAYLDKPIPIYHIPPSRSSNNLGVGGNAKWLRCSGVAQLGGGKYAWPNMDAFDYKERMKESDHGWCEGGSLAGANADALDAGAIAWSARTIHIEARLVALVRAEEKERKKKHKKT